MDLSFEIECRVVPGVVFLCGCVEGLGGYHEVTDDFTEVSDRNPYVPKETIAGTSPNDHYCFMVIPIPGRFPWQTIIGVIVCLPFCENPRRSSPKEIVPYLIYLVVI